MEVISLYRRQYIENVLNEWQKECLAFRIFWADFNVYLLHIYIVILLLIPV